MWGLLAVQAHMSSRSTASELHQHRAANFAQNYKLRHATLVHELEKLGIREEQLWEPNLKGSPAVRMFNSFLLPKSAGAAAMADSPHRAATIASSIAFVLRERRAHNDEWLRNHDRSIEEINNLPEQAHPITVVLDNIRSAHNCGQIFRALEAART